MIVLTIFLQIKLYKMAIFNDQTHIRYNLKFIPYTLYLIPYTPKNPYAGWGLRGNLGFPLTISCL